MIAEIDQWVITQATKIAAGGKAVGVNLSAASAGDPRVLDLIERELRNDATDPGNLVFEITETAVMQDMNRATRPTYCPNRRRTSGSDSFHAPGSGSGEALMINSRDGPAG